MTTRSALLTLYGARVAHRARPAQRVRAPPCANRFNSSDPLSWSAINDDDDGDLGVGGQAESPLQQLTEAELDYLLGQQTTPPPTAFVSSSAAPSTAAESIAAGLLEFKRGKYAAALLSFTAAEQLPGRGVLRVRGKARDLSDGERQAARYNAAAAHAKLGAADDALTALRLAIDAGFADGALLSRDEDFAELRAGRSAEWAALVGPITRKPGPLDWILKA